MRESFEHLLHQSARVAISAKTERKLCCGRFTQSSLLTFPPSQASSRRDPPANPQSKYEDALEANADDQYRLPSELRLSDKFPARLVDLHSQLEKDYAQAGSTGKDSHCGHGH